MLQDSSENIAGYIDNVEKLEFVKVDSNRSNILPPRSFIQSGWVIFPLVAGSMLVVYGLLIGVRQRRTMLYRNLETDDKINYNLFALDNKLRSDAIDIPEYLERKQWDDIQIIYDDGDFDNDDAFNRESLARSEKRFQMPSANKIDNGQLDE